MIAPYLTPVIKGHRKDRHLVLNYIKIQVEKGTGLCLAELKQKYAEDALFYIALQHITTTKKAISVAMGIPVEACCRYKRELEKNGLLVQSKDEFLCPYTGSLAHVLSTNPSEFERLNTSHSNQLTLF